MIVCQQGSVYELYKTVYKFPKGNILVAAYKAEKQRVFKPNKSISAFRADKANKEHVKAIYIESKDLKPWESAKYNGQEMKERDSFFFSRNSRQICAWYSYTLF
jgi:hypothetical protein